MLHKNSIIADVDVNRRVMANKNTVTKLYPELAKFYTGRQRNCSKCMKKSFSRAILSYILNDKELKNKDRALLKAILPGSFVDSLGD